MKNLNTINSFLIEGFKIERDGRLFTLTAEEMSDFRYLDKALDGKNCLECYSAINDEEAEIVKSMMEDEEICYNIEDDILEILYNDAGDIEADVIHDYIERNMEG